MPEIINSMNKEKNDLKNNFYHKFLFVDDVSKLKKIKPGIELCIIQTDFEKFELKNIKKIKSAHKNIEFWISSNNLSRENVLASNKLGIKTIVSSPINEKMVEEFFNNKEELINPKERALTQDYSGISNLKVMIVDDNNMNVELLEEILSKFNLNITSCLKPKEAMGKVLHEKFDLFLLDIMMPEMSGFELAQKIKETPHNQNVPIIFISALSDSHNKIKGYNLGSFAYIEKPFDVNVIRSQIFNILKNKKAQEILASGKEDFLATVAHDLKTPIRAGINALNLLKSESLGKSEESEIIDDLINSTKFMQDMVENILCRNKIESNQISLSKQVYCLKELVEHCIELTKYILVPKKQQVKFNCNLNNTLIPMDFLEMKRALHNLIANASAYSPVGSKILVKIFEKGDKLGLYVQDFGRGIDLEHQKDVFLQYMSFAKQYKTVGSGLGLYITKKIIEAHEGEIILESRIGYGTKITFFLPIYNKQ